MRRQHYYHTDDHEIVEIKIVPNRKKMAVGRWVTGAGRGGGRSSCILVTQKGTKSFKVLTAGFLLLPFFLVVCLYGRAPGASSTRSTTATATHRHTTTITTTSSTTREWPPAAWPCIHDLQFNTSVGEMIESGAKVESILVYLGQEGQGQQKTTTSSIIKDFLFGLVKLALSQDPSTLPLGEQIEYMWESKRKQGGIFRTSVDGAKTRHSEGKSSPWAVELYRNPGRASKPDNMKAQDVESVSLPFDPEKFNFLQPKANDLLFWYQLPAAEKEREGKEDTSITTTTSCQPIPPPPSIPSTLHGVFLNPYPIGFLSGVLCPYLFERRPQGLPDSEDALMAALSFAAELEPKLSPGNDRLHLRVGFNSLGARASINHLHFQFWSWSDSPDSLLPIERAPKRKVPTSFPNANLYVIDNSHHPIQSLALTATSLPALAAAGANCIDLLMKRNTAFSLLMDGSVLYIMPRRFSNATFPFCSVGFPEAGGMLLVTSDEYWEDDKKLNADVVWELWQKEYNLRDEDFAVLVEGCGNGGAGGERDGPGKEAGRRIR